jgi:hypothetical protein
MIKSLLMTSTGCTILFAGMIAADPYQGGATWAVLQYVLGLKSLGHEVVFVEPVPLKALRPAGALLQHSLNAEYFRAVVEEFELSDAAALLLAETRETVGLAYEQILEAATRADVLVNVSGMLTDREILGRIPTRVYLDLDPAFIQLWHAVQGIDMRLDAHTHFVTVGLAIGSPMCRVPTCGREWIPTLQPIVLKHWPLGREVRYDALTTVGNWRGYGSIDHDGEFYGQKVHSIREIIALPKHTSEKLLLAIEVHSEESPGPADLKKYGWELISPANVAATPSRYRRFIQQSKGEFGLAKSGYIKSKCGWFSDRSVCYLASGRPVVAQETGFSRYLPTGAGLFAFESVEQAVRCIDEANNNYPAHSVAARRLAETHFDSNKVLISLLRRVGATA